MKKEKSVKKVWQVIAGLAFVLILSILPGFNDLIAQETSAFVADTTVSKALSSGWEGEAFTAVFHLSGKGGGFAEGNWKLSVNPPFPHPVSGLDDSYIQAALGMSLINMEAEAGMSWLLRAAMQDQEDAMMVLAIAYASNRQVMNVDEAERWFRKAIELGISDAETKLNDLLAGKQISPLFKTTNAYNFSFSLVK